MPALTINTDTTTTQPSYPNQPPISPVTPPPQTSNTTQTHPPPLSLSHNTHPSQVPTMPQPPTQPLDFDANPDVIALKSAISILQMQKQRATRQIQHLEKAREEALQRPGEFLRDFTEGNVRIGEPPVQLQDDEDEDDSEDDDEEMANSAPQNQDIKPWSHLPGPQNIVRCPPINWSQYAVVGDSLDKLHAEQQKRPMQGTPAKRLSDGSWQHQAGDGLQEEYRGVAAPYAPFKDNVRRKSGGK